MKKIILWLMQTETYSWLLKHVIPYIRFSLYYTSFRGWKYKRGYKKLKKGHIILTLDKKKLTSLLIPGNFSHAALCVDKGPDSEWEVSEMTHTDYTKSCFFDICKESDRVVIGTCGDWDDEYIDKVLIPACKSFEGAKYDSNFELGVKALYCSELIYQSDIEKRLKYDLDDLAGIGRPYISPDGISKSPNFKVVWDSDDEIL